MSSSFETSSTATTEFMFNLDELILNNNHDDHHLSDDLKFLIKKIDREVFLKKLRHSIDVIKNAIELSTTSSSSDICIAFNGGKDCCVVLYLFYIVASHNGFFTKHQRKFHILIMKLNEQFRELDDFVEKLFQNYYANDGINLIVMEKPKMKLKKCLELFKETHPDILYILMGTRRTDGQYVMKLNDFEATDSDWPYFMRVNPLLDWSYSEIWYFIKRFKIPYCSLYDLGYTSLGDINNTIKNEVLYDAELGTYKPAYMLDNDYNERNSRI